ncbi:MAG: glycoside hydrolase family 27 protein [Leadbetterella sp.]
MLLKRIPILCLILGIFSSLSFAQVAPKPPMGWNSFDSYGVYLHEKAAWDNLKELAKTYKKYGYEYFVVDNGWFGEYKLKSGTMYPNEKHASDIRINEYGLVQPSKTYFPNGFKDLINECHRLGLKFGFHLMRGIPRKAYDLNTPIQGTSYYAKDIADTLEAHLCNWCKYNYGVDMDKPGAQEYYNSLVNQMAAWGVDMLKVDDVVPFPKEAEGYAKAIAQCGRPMVLSLSPGNGVSTNAIKSFKMANMLRVTPDVWDEQIDIDNCFAAWRKWSGYSEPNFWIDMDMIPFGNLQLMSPPALGPQKEVRLSGRGTTRKCQLSPAQMRTFITLRAISASPLMMGGDLPTMDAYSKELMTNKHMLEANQNGIMGTLVYEKDGIEIWKILKKNSKGGWIGIFNRNPTKTTLETKLDYLKLTKATQILDVWNKKTYMTLPKKVTLVPNDALFWVF